MKYHLDLQGRQGDQGQAGGLAYLGTMHTRALPECLCYMGGTMTATLVAKPPSRWGAPLEPCTWHQAAVLQYSVTPSQSRVPHPLESFCCQLLRASSAQTIF